MDFFSRSANQFRQFWDSASPSGKVSVLVAGAAIIATIVGAAVWSSMPDYKLLRDGISPVLTAEIVSVLDANGIQNRMNYSGTGVMVPTSKWNAANIAISSLGIPDQAGATPSENALFPGKANHLDSVRAKELAIEHSLATLRAVKSADVHLAIPEPSPFRRNRQPASASIVIEPHPNQIISRELGMSMIHMVASAVEGMDPKNVTLANADGTLLGNVGNDDPAANRREYVRDLEAGLAMKAQDVLSAVLGPNKSVVRVTADVDDFLDKVTTVNKIDADAKVRLEEKIVTSDKKGLPLTPGGVAGTSSNSAAIAQTGVSGQQVSGKEETNETTYDYPRTIEKTHEIGGQTMRLSVSATVDVTPDDVAAGGTAAEILTQEQVENIIKSAVGYDETRGDQIQVVLTEFSAIPAAALPPPVPDVKKWEFMENLARHVSLGLASIVALLIGLMTIRKLKPVQVQGAEGDQRRRDLLSELSSRVDQNPEAVSRILASWLDREHTGGAGSSATKKAA